MKNKHIKRSGAAILAAVLTVCMLFTGCGKSASCWEISFNGTSLNLADSFEAVVKKAVKADIPVMNFMMMYLYDENAEKSSVKAMDVLGKSYEKRNELLYINQVKDQKFALTDILADKETGNLQKFKFANGMSYTSKETGLSKEFINLASYNLAGAKNVKDNNNYTALVADGTFVDLSERIAGLPAELSDSDLDKLETARFDCGRAGSELLPNRWVYMPPEADFDAKEAFRTDESFRNTVALIWELESLLSALENGEIKHLGTISYSFNDGEMVSMEYKILLPIEEE